MKRCGVMIHPLRVHRRRTSGRIAGALGLLLVAIGCGGSPEANRADEATLIVAPDRVVEVEVKRLEAGVPFTGELRPIVAVTVKAQIDGDLDAVLVREGTRVRAGQPLARFDPGDTRDRHATAEADFLAAKAGAIAATSDLERVERLLAAGAASPAELELAHASAEAAEARVRLAEAARNRATDDLARLDVPSPIAGEVSQRFVDQGDHVAVGDPLMTVVDTETLELAATIPADALSRVRVGTPVRFRVDAFPDRTFSGEVARVNPVTEPGTRQVQIYVRLPNPERLLVGGLFASGRVIDAIAESALAVPVATLRQEADVSVIYAIRDGRTVRVPVTTGFTDEVAGLVAVTGDLAAGDSLLMGTVPGLRSGLPIRLSGSNGNSSGNNGGRESDGAAGAEAAPGHAAGR